MITVFSVKKAAILSFLCLCAFCGNAQPGDAIRDSVKTHNLETVTIHGTANIRRNNTYRFSLKEVKPLISVIGETDVLRYIGTLPGVSQGMEGSLGFFVRGSNNGNNRIELDDVPVYGSAHLFGLFSVFPADAVENVTFLAGKIPSSSGDFLSSLTQISTIQPDTVKYRGNFSVSPFMAGLSISGPVIKDRLSFQIAGRMSLLRPEIQLLKKLTEMEGDIVPEVADVYAKLHYRLNSQHTINLSGYYSNDYFKYHYVDEWNNNTIEQNWGNKIFRLSWDWKISETLQMNTMTYYNHFASGQRQRNSDRAKLKSDLRMQTALQEWSARSVLSYRKNNLSVTGGLQGKSQLIRPAAEKVYIGEQADAPNNHYAFNPSHTSILFTGFLDFEYKYRSVTSSVGYRGNYYSPENQPVYDNNIRLALAVELSKTTGLELSYDELSQFHHIVEGLPVGWSLDLIIPANQTFRPEKAHQYYAGGFWSNQPYLLSAGVYYKTMNNLTSYKNASNIFGVQNTNWMDEVVNGQGESYGLELRTEVKKETWNVAASYTLSKTDRLFKDMNNDRAFPFKFDRRHIFNLTGQILTRKQKTGEQRFNMVLALSSGHHITLPIGIYQGVEPPYWSNQSGIYVPPKEQENAFYRQLMSETNGYSLPYYLRMDIGYTFLRMGKRFSNEFTIGVFNVLNRQNPYLVFYDEGHWKQLSIFPILPSFKWSLNF